MSLLRCLLLFFALFPLQCLAVALQYSVQGVEGELRENVLAWLGEPPDSPQARLNFIATARDRVERSLQALGHYRPEIDLQVQRTEPIWQMTIDIEPGEPVHLRKVSIEVLGDAAADAAFDRLLDEQTINPGDVLNHGVYEDFKRALLALGQQRGYLQGQLVQQRVKVEAIEGNADLFLHYDSGPRYRFGAVNFDHEQLASDVLAPLLTFSEGDYFDQPRLQETQAMLQRTGYFSTVILRPLVGEAADTVVPLDLQLFPAKRHSFDVGLGYSTDTRERVSVTWRTPRINRLGHSQETRVEYSKINPSGRFTYTIPLTHPLKDILQLSARVEDNEFGDLDSSQEELSVRRERRFGQWVQGYSLRGLNESWDSEGLRRENDYLLPGYSISRRDHRGSVVNPSAGFSQFYLFEAASSHLGSDVDLLRVSTRFGAIASLGERHRFVSRLELGVALLSEEDRANLAPSLSFFAGGSQSIRGFSYQSIGNELVLQFPEGEQKTLVVGGEHLVVGSVEYQYAFTPQWRGALFVDGGDAFNDGDFNNNYSVGFGVHYVTPVGALRLELANPLSKDDPSWRFHLAIGAEF